MGWMRRPVVEVIGTRQGKRLRTASTTLSNKASMLLSWELPTLLDSDTAAVVVVAGTVVVGTGG